MAAVAKIKHIRMTPRKMRVVANQIRGKEIQKAIDYLQFCKRRAAGPILKLVKSAVANATHKGDVDIDNLYIKKLTVDDGPTMRRWLPRARGIATKILKRTSHVTVELGEK
ncbi:MAG: 50S ribosomal protein L22 [Deltaproteobacteria bacterium CG07_land_8_20_14_0_80_38_7]|nr:MAG: 50S ribosomal protein L22 [Deltaproteobacteria bacterium CG07_land_8_20_14_0_80_38_7]